MGMPLGGVGPQGVNPSGSQQPVNVNQAAQTIDGAKDVIQQELLVFDREAAFVGSKQAKGGVEQDATQVQKQPKDVQHAVEGYAAVIGQDEVDKKKKTKKKSSFEEKMAELENVEEMIDETQVDEESKGIVREFFDNMSRIRNLRSRFRRLEEEEKLLEEKVKEKEVQEKDQQQQQNQQQYQQPQPPIEDDQDD